MQYRIGVAAVLVYEYTIPFGCHMETARVQMSAFLPYPNHLSVVAAAAVLVHRELTKGAEASAVFETPKVGLSPGCIVVAPADALIGVTAHAERGVKRPSKLRATLDGRLLERDGRW